MMQVAARYIEDRSVDVRHVAVVTLSCTAVKGDRNVIKLVSKCLDDGSKRKEGCVVAHMFTASLGAPACEHTIPVGSLSLSSQLYRSILWLTIERDLVARSEIAV